ncbi:hypothetical protein EZS27_026015 [termite gut metagenome]|uniref:Glycosyltransferase 2-like domain-containing protein n=1 Tax=termite gut metagenome TaxID=433724 RepID=A0A5J4QS04_9ZZZZ
MLNYYPYYNFYNNADRKITEYRAIGGVYRHFFALPYKLVSTICCKIILKCAARETSFPLLNNQSGIIISLTSFPPRISSLHLVIRSLLKQTCLPERIIIWLSEEEFPNKMNDIPSSLKSLIPYGLEIRFVPDNIRAHKKYFYCLKEFLDKIVITVDDDLYYPTYTIEKLLMMHTSFPYSICANVIRKIAVANHAFLPYKKWEKIFSMSLSVSHEYMAIGYGGVLYPPSFPTDKSFFDLNIIKMKCLYADDLWLKANELRLGVEVASGGDFFVNPITLPHSQKVGLQKRNNSSLKMNDIQWEKLRQYFNLDEIYARICQL